MPRKRHYPPSQIKYQMEHPPVTVHLNKDLKEVLDVVKGSRSYAQVISDMIRGSIDMEKQVKRLPLTEAVLKYNNGFREARFRYSIVGDCRKCHRESYLWNDGICDFCHNRTAIDPDYSEFKSRELSEFIEDADFEKLKLKIPPTEKAIYENGKQRGIMLGTDEGYREAEGEFKITFPCIECGEPIHMRPESDAHKEMRKYMREHGWHHGNCGK